MELAELRSETLRQEEVAWRARETVLEMDVKGLRQDLDKSRSEVVKLEAVFVAQKHAAVTEAELEEARTARGLTGLRRRVKGHLENQKKKDAKLAESNAEVLRLKRTRIDDHLKIKTLEALAAERLERIVRGACRKLW